MVQLSEKFPGPSGVLDGGVRVGVQFGEDAGDGGLPQHFEDRALGELVVRAGEDVDLGVQFQGAPKMLICLMLVLLGWIVAGDLDGDRVRGYDEVCDEPGVLVWQSTASRVLPWCWGLWSGPGLGHRLIEVFECAEAGPPVGDGAGGSGEEVEGQSAVGVGRVAG